MKRFLVLAILILALPKTMFCASYLSDREFRDLRNNSACLARILAHDPYNVTKIHDTDSIRSLIKAGIDPDWGDGWGHGLLHKLLAGTNNDCHGERGDKQMPFFPQKTLFLLLEAKCDPSRTYGNCSSFTVLSFIEQIKDHSMRVEIEATLALWEKTVEQRDEEAFAKLAAAQKIQEAPQSAPTRRLAVAAAAYVQNPNFATTVSVGTQTEDPAAPPPYYQV